MITKITAENELEFFAPAFEAITKAFAAASNLPNIVVNSLESYYGNLEYIKQLPTELGEQGKYLLVPFDEPLFEIDANARTITVPDAFKKNGVAVQGDHQAELLVFKVDRYFDYQDLLKTDISINWNFTPYGSRTSTLEGYDRAFAKTLYSDTDYVVFGFIITKDMTPTRGTINFSVNFFTTGTEGIDYSLNTITTSVVVNEGLMLVDPSKVKPVNQSFIGRLGNSSYTPETQTPIESPMWETGSADESGKMLGLKNKQNFEYADSEKTREEDSVVLVAQAYAPGATVKYKWLASPVTNSENIIVDHEVEGETTNVDRPTSINDYFETSDTEANSKSTYYKKNEAGQLDLDNPLTQAEAQEAMDNGETLYELGSSYVATMAGNYVVEAFGYRESMVGVSGTVLEPNPNDTSINVTAKKLMTIPKDNNEAACRKNQNSIMVTQDENNISIVGNLDSLETFASTNAAQGSGKWIGLDLGVNVDSITELTWNGSALTTADVEESASVDLPANHIIFWVKAENLPRTIKIGNGEEEASLKVYFVEGQAITATSNTIQSNVCSIPVAVKPVFEEKPIAQSADLDTDYTVTNENSEFIYIDSENAPVVKVKLKSEDEAEALGLVAVELIDANTSEEDLKLDIDTIQSKIADGSYTFVTVPEDGELTVPSTAVTEGEYCVRAINYRNHTYAISDLSESIKTSFVAPAVTKLTVKGKAVGSNATITLLIDGKTPSGVAEDHAYITYNDAADDKTINFTIENNELPENMRGVVSYIVEEVKMVNGEYQVLTPGDNGQIGPDEVIVKDGETTFSIVGDSGLYRIRTENRYNDTLRIAYTDVFAIYAS